MSKLTSELMLRALGRLDELIGQSGLGPVTLIVGGGGAMLLAHGYKLATSDIDAIPKGMDLGPLDDLVKRIAIEQSLPPDWLNPYFSTYSHTLPSDYGSRLIEVFSGGHLDAQALGTDELLIMKCFAHRQKDVGHAKALIRKGASIAKVEAHIESLRKKGIPQAREALDFLDDILEQLGE